MQSSLLAYAGWTRCLRITNGTAELIATTEVGPRIIRFGFVGGPNEFVEYPDQVGQTGGADYRSYGGHRLWVAPETKGWTNHPDNSPVAVVEDSDSATLTAEVERGTGLQKQVRISFLTGPASVRVEHRVTNRGSSTVRLAPWAVSVMAPGGTAVFPQEPQIPHGDKVLPARPMVLWNYTDMRDPRWTWGSRLVLLRQDRASTTPQKVGALITQGWAAYVNGGRVFLKRFSFDPAGTYEDHGANAEFFTNSRMLEVETLGPRVDLRPDASVVHVEHWYLARGLAWPADEVGQSAALTELLNHTVVPEIDAREA